MDLIIILQAGVASGTVLLFATIGEIFAERSGVHEPGRRRHDADRRDERLQRRP